MLPPVDTRAQTAFLQRRLEFITDFVADRGGQERLPTVVAPTPLAAETAWELANRGGFRATSHVFPATGRPVFFHGSYQGTSDGSGYDLDSVRYGTHAFLWPTSLQPWTSEQFPGQTLHIPTPEVARRIADDTDRSHEFFIRCEANAERMLADLLALRAELAKREAQRVSGDSGDLAERAAELRIAIRNIEVVCDGAVDPPSGRVTHRHRAIAPAWYQTGRYVGSADVGYPNTHHRYVTLAAPSPIYQHHFDIRTYPRSDRGIATFVGRPTKEVLLDAMLTGPVRTVSLNCWNHDAIPAATRAIAVALESQTVERINVVFNQTPAHLRPHTKKLYALAEADPRLRLPDPGQGINSGVTRSRAFGTPARNPRASDRPTRRL